MNVSPINDHSVILITGASGMLGRAFTAAIRRAHPSTHILAKTKAQLDVTNKSDVMKLASSRLDFIIHCAGNTNADFCEDHPECAHGVHVRGTQNIIDLAKVSGAKILYPQSFLIFNSSGNPIHEQTPPNPLSVYGRCKLEAEKILIAQLPSSLIIRMAGFFGGGAADKNFVGKFCRHIASLISEGKTAYAVGDRVWQPTFTNDLAANSLLLLDRNKSGVYHMASQGAASFFEVAKACVELLELQPFFQVLEAPGDLIDKRDKAERPRCAMLSTAKLEAEQLYAQRPWQDSLAEYLAEPYFSGLFAKARKTYAKSLRMPRETPAYAAGTV